jgi:transcriptional regulator with XRE-family HTH domain
MTITANSTEPVTLLQDTNLVVAANLRAIRLERGLTQAQVADRLGELTGRTLPQASISQMESGGYPSGRRRRFDAHDLVLLGQVLEVPVVYFFLPQPGAHDTTERLRGLLGRGDALEAVDERLTDLASSSADRTVGLLAELAGGTPRSPDAGGYRSWRDQRLAAVEEALRDDADELADILGRLAAAIKQAGPSGFLRHLVSG